MSAIEISGLVKKYGDVVAVDNVDLTIEDGEFLTILGPSGSGKTTILLIIAGFEQPTSGSVFFDDKDVTELPPHKRRVGLTFQSYALFPHMSVEGNVVFPLKVRGVGREERRTKVDRALDLVRLGDLHHRRPHELSGGQQQRVALARALVFEPDILLLDEPLAALDRQLRQTVQYELSELQRSLKVTTVAVTHDQEEALTMSDRILVLHEGRVQQIGKPEDVYRCPRNRFVATFLGTANLFEGVVKYEGDRHYIVCPTLGEKVPIDSHFAASSAVAMLRPEQLHVGAPDTGRVNAGVKAAVYLGTAIRYQMVLADGSLVEATASNARRFAVGDVVGLDWLSEDLWIIPEEA